MTTITLPALPMHDDEFDILDKAAIRAIQIAAMRAALEAAAKVCDGLHWTWHMGDDSGPKECAQQIRALRIEGETP